MGIQFIHLFALSVWVGGIVFIQTVLAPILSEWDRSSLSSEFLLNEVFRKFYQTTLFCSAAMVITGIIKFWHWENLTPWNLIRYLAIGIMASVALYTALKISPRLGRGKTVEISESTAASASHQRRLRQISNQLLLVNLICGLTALLMA